ncbi:MAG: sel1 repeat family protein [Epsilonproteobacteria bacterium]|nr:sel1 repeat family protein [Campylobacterota bacterium]
MMKLFLLTSLLVYSLFAEVKGLKEYDLAMKYLAEQNYKAALKPLQTAAENNISNAQYNLALMYYRGDGVQQDVKKSAEWLEKAAKNGHERAIANIGRIYMQLLDFKKARHWLEINVKNGDKEAELLLKEIEAAEQRLALLKPLKLLTQRNNMPNNN